MDHTSEDIQSTGKPAFLLLTICDIVCACMHVCMYACACACDNTHHNWSTMVSPPISCFSFNSIYKPVLWSGLTLPLSSHLSLPNIPALSYWWL